MGEIETGVKWWMRYVIVPIIGGGGIVALIIAFMSNPISSRPPQAKALGEPAMALKPPTESPSIIPARDPRRATKRVDSASPVRGPVGFERMEITFNTGGNDKPSDTRCEIFIVRRDGEQAVAYLDIQGREFGRNTSQTFSVPPLAGGFTLGQLRDEKISVKIAPPGYETWGFSFSAVLYFADGTTARLDVPMGSLTQGNRQGFYPLAWAAMTAGPTR
jgi:hypothetical protein